jgi:hypothetical protein
MDNNTDFEEKMHLIRLYDKKYQDFKDLENIINLSHNEGLITKNFIDDLYRLLRKNTPDTISKEFISKVESLLRSELNTQKEYLKNELKKLMKT